MASSYGRDVFNCIETVEMVSTVVAPFPLPPAVCGHSSSSSPELRTTRRFGFCHLNRYVVEQNFLVVLICVSQRGTCSRGRGKALNC